MAPRGRPGGGVGPGRGVLFSVDEEITGEQEIYCSANSAMKSPRRSGLAL